MAIDFSKYQREDGTGVQNGAHGMIRHRHRLLQTSPLRSRRKGSRTAVFNRVLPDIAVTNTMTTACNRPTSTVMTTWPRRIFSLDTVLQQDSEWRDCDLMALRLSTTLINSARDDVSGCGGKS